MSDTERTDDETAAPGRWHAEVLAHLDERSMRSYLPAVPIAEAERPGCWSQLADIATDPAILGAWYDVNVDRHAGGHRDLAGSLLAGGLSGPLVELVSMPLWNQHRALDVDVHHVAMFRNGDDWFDTMAVSPPTIHVLADDPAATDVDDAGVRVAADHSELVSVAAASLHRLVAASFGIVRSFAPFGVRGMWGTVADQIGGQATRRARHDGHEPAAAWAAASQLIDALAEREPLLVVRPHRTELQWPGGEAIASVKGTCCLIYKARPDADRSTSEGYCGVCPLTDEPARRERLIGQFST